MSWIGSETLFLLISWSNCCLQQKLNTAAVVPSASSTVENLYFCSTIIAHFALQASLDGLGWLRLNERSSANSSVAAGLSQPTCLMHSLENAQGKSA